MNEKNERLWLSAQEGAIGSHYNLSLIGRGESQRVGTIHPLAGGGWVWNVRLKKLDGEISIEKGQAQDAETASDQQFEALTRMEPERFRRLAA